MKVLKAPTDITIDRITSVGMVSFVEGIATEFTDEQAAHFRDKIGGYEVIETDDLKVPKADKTKKADEAKKAKAAKKKIDNAKAEEERLAKEKEDEDKRLADEKAKEDGKDDGNPDGKNDGIGEPAITKIEIDETTPYPKLVAWVKEFEIPTPNGKNAEELLKACLADEHFMPTKPKE